MSGPLPALVLAAGRGQRMRPLTASLAKPVLPVLGQTLLARIVGHLSQCGVGPIAVNAFHAPESLRAVLGNLAPQASGATLFVENRLMDTGGALAAPAELLAEGESFLLYNGDTLLDPPLEALRRAASEADALGALLVRPGRTEGYAAVGVREGSLSHLRAEPGDDPATYLGVAVLRRELLEQVPRDRPSSLFPDVVLPALSGGRRLATVAHDGRWIEFTDPASYLARILALVNEADASAGLALPGGDVRVQCRGNARLVAAADAQVSSQAVLSGAVVAECGARIAAEAVLSDAVLMDGACVEAGARVTYCVVGPRARIGSGDDLRSCVATVDPGGDIIKTPLRRA